MAPSQPLPLEIVTLIVEEVVAGSEKGPDAGLFASRFLNNDARRVLRTLLLVDRAWARIARRLLRQNISISVDSTSGNRAISFITLNASDEDLERITHLQMTFPDLEKRSSKVLAMLDMLCAGVFKRLPDLQALSLSGFHPIGDTDWPLTSAAIRSLESLEYFVIRMMPCPMVEDRPATPRLLRTLATDVVTRCASTLEGFGLLGRIPADPALMEALAEAEELHSLHFEAAEPEGDYDIEEIAALPSGITDLHVDLEDDEPPTFSTLYGLVMSTLLAENSEWLRYFVVTGRGSTSIGDVCGVTHLHELRSLVLPRPKNEAQAGWHLDFAREVAVPKLESLTISASPIAYLALLARLSEGWLPCLRKVIVRDAPLDHDPTWDPIRQLLRDRGITLLRERRHDK